MWSLLPGRGKPILASRKRRSWFGQQPNVGAAKTLLSRPRLADYLSRGQVVVRGKASCSRNVLTDPWKFREWKQLECYKKTDLQDQRNKTGYTVCHSGKQGQGWVEGGGEVVRESSRTFQQNVPASRACVARDWFGM